MTHAELTRDLQLERANLIAHLSRARTLLAKANGMLQADKTVDAMLGTKHLTPTSRSLLSEIEAYLKVGMFDQLPEEIAR